MKSGVFPNLSMREYLAAEALSAGVIHTLNTQCPKAAWYESHLNARSIDVDEDDDTAESDTGSVSHQILLEGSRDCCAIINPEDHPAEKTGAIPRGWTNKSIRQARDTARAAGKIPMMPASMNKCMRIVESAREYIDSLRTTEPAIWGALQPDGGQSELSVFFEQEGILSRMRPDRISNDRRIVVHLKTTATNVEPEAWARTQMAGYWLTAAWYRLGIDLTFGVPDSQHFFLVVGQKPPHLCSLIGVDPAGMAHGVEQMDVGFREWQRCVAANRFPGYPARAVYPEVPAYEIARWQEHTAVREAVEDLGERGMRAWEAATGQQRRAA